MEGDPDCPFNQGTLCMRCLEMPEAVNHPDRPTGPLKRAGERGENKWEPVTWVEAYDIIEEKVRAFQEKDGPESVVLELHVAPEDMGKVIGRQGRIAKAIRTLVKAATVKDEKPVFVEIV